MTYKFVIRDSDIKNVDKKTSDEEDIHKSNFKRFLNIVIKLIQEYRLIGYIDL